MKEELILKATMLLHAGMHQQHLHTKQLQDAATSNAVQAGSPADLLTK